MAPLTLSSTTTQHHEFGRGKGKNNYVEFLEKYLPLNPFMYSNFVTFRNSARESKSLQDE